MALAWQAVWLGGLIWGFVKVIRPILPQSTFPLTGLRKRSPWKDEDIVLSAIEEYVGILVPLLVAVL